MDDEQRRKVRAQEKAYSTTLPYHLGGGSQPAARRRIMPSITLIDGGPERFVRTLIGPETTLGRDANCDVVLDNPSVSRVHAVLRWDNCSTPFDRPRCSIRDLGSRNGVYVNRVRVLDTLDLQHQDQIGIGDMIFGFYLRDDQELAQMGPVPPVSIGKRSSIPRPMRVVRAVDVRATICLPDETKTPLHFSATTQDLSLDGMSLTTDALSRALFSKMLKFQRLAELKLTIPDESQPLTLNGKLVWMRLDNVRRGETCTIGIQFTQLTRETREALQRLLFRNEDITSDSSRG